jgi:hypothetical protein
MPGARAPGIFVCGEARKQFFFEKKNQKTFDSLVTTRATVGSERKKVFLLLFLQKKKILPSYSARATMFSGSHVASSGNAMMMNTITTMIANIGTAVRAT